MPTVSSNSSTARWRHCRAPLIGNRRRRRRRRLFVLANTGKHIRAAHAKVSQSALLFVVVVVVVAVDFLTDRQQLSEVNDLRATPGRNDFNELWREEFHARRRREGEPASFLQA